MDIEVSLRLLDRLRWIAEDETNLPKAYVAL